MFKDGVDQGYRKDPNWWFNPGPDQFRIAKLNEDYPEEYFPLAQPPKEALMAIVRHSKDLYLKWAPNSQRPHLGFSNGIVDFGAAGGWTMNAFLEQGINATGFEGSFNGYLFCKKNFEDGAWQALWYDDVRQYLREPPSKYDMAICTEVAEHIEWPFHSTLVNNLIRYSDFIWWSSEGPEVDNSPHLHHCAEAPLQYWIKLFEYFGFDYYPLPKSVTEECAGRGQCVFYNPRTYTP